MINYSWQLYYILFIITILVKKCLGFYDFQQNLKKANSLRFDYQWTSSNLMKLSTMTNPAFRAFLLVQNYSTHIKLNEKVGFPGFCQLFYENYDENRKKWFPIIPSRCCALSENITGPRSPVEKLFKKKNLKKCCCSC